MRRTLALVAFAAAFAGCGDTCSTKAAGVNALSSAGCTVSANQAMTIQVKGSCQACTDSNPSCNTEVVGGGIDLNPIYSECAANAGCPGTSCGYPTFNCSVPGLAAGSYTVTAVTDPSTGATTTTTVTVVAASGNSTCVL